MLQASFIISTVQIQKLRQRLRTKIRMQLLFCKTGIAHFAVEVFQLSPRAHRIQTLLSSYLTGIVSCSPGLEVKSGKEQLQGCLMKLRGNLHWKKRSIFLLIQSREFTLPASGQVFN